VDCGSEEEAWEVVCESIDAGRPCLTRVGFGFRVVCGYDPAGRMMHMRDYNTAGEAYGVIPFEAPKAPWPLETGHEVILIHYEPTDEAPQLDWPEILERAVRFADFPPQERLARIYAFGLGAYDAWAQTVLQGPDRNGPETCAGVLDFMAKTMAETREAAAAVLDAHRDVHDSFATAAEHYRAEADLWQMLSTTLAGGAAGDFREFIRTMGHNLEQDGAARERTAEVVNLAKAEEIDAVDALRAALVDLTKQADQPAAAAPAPAPQPAPGPAEPRPDQAANKAAAMAHFERGSALKKQGRFAEAAAELRKAIGDDPGLVEAHWVVAWVLVELKDTEGATKEFRKVIELAPGTDRAKEAERAIERLNQ
jgi:tetratricopeptide (TPR) repeat protein